MTRYRAAVIGCGRIGAGYDDDPLRGYVATHAGAYAANPDVTLVALCDTDREKVERYAAKYDVPGRYTDVSAMLRDTTPELVSICTHADTHRTLVEQCAAAGVRAIFCEKPMATTLDDADAMIRVCRDRGVVLLIDHQRRFEQFHRAFRDALLANAIGRIQSVACTYGGGIRNTGSHLIDVLRFCLGEVSWVWATARAAGSPNADDPNGDGVVGFRSGIVAHLVPIDTRHHALFEFAFIGTEGRAVLNSVGNHVTVQYARAESSPASREIREIVPAQFPVAPLPSYECMRDAVAHLVACVEGRALPWSTGEDGRDTLRVVLALLVSMHARMIVTL